MPLDAQGRDARPNDLVIRDETIAVVASGLTHGWSLVRGRESMMLSTRLSARLPPRRGGKKRGPQSKQIPWHLVNHEPFSGWGILLLLSHPHPLEIRIPTSNGCLQGLVFSPPPPLSPKPVGCFRRALSTTPLFWATHHEKRCHPIYRVIQVASQAAGSRHRTGREPTQPDLHFCTRTSRTQGAVQRRSLPQMSPLILIREALAITIPRPSSPLPCLS
ncbi:hypothetical protein EV126DRAFT_115544 [Verticillium dahliae]|nr:hypothetical protein EV126DRAFT_115544 [Verticillium dahliae]